MQYKIFVILTFQVSFGFIFFLCCFVLPIFVQLIRKDTQFFFFFFFAILFFRCFPLLFPLILHFCSFFFPHSFLTFFFFIFSYIFLSFWHHSLKFYCTIKYFFCCVFFSDWKKREGKRKGRKKMVFLEVIFFFCR